MATSYNDIDGDALDLSAQAILSNRSIMGGTATLENIDTISDNEWARNAFLVNAENISEDDFVNRTYTSAQFKFQDTSLGGSLHINPRPQFTRYADTRIKGYLSHRVEVSPGLKTGRIGMGHFYSEAHDDTSQTIHMRFGVPEFNSLTTFFSGFYDARAGRLARTGRIEADMFEKLGYAVGFVVSIIAWPLMLASFLGNAFRFFMGKPSSKYYYLSPRMPLYWHAVTTMVNEISVNRGLTPAFVPFGNNKNLGNTGDQAAGSIYEVDNALVQQMAEMLPDIFDERGGIDVYNVANRAQRMKNQLDKMLDKAMEDTTTFDGFVKKYKDDIATIRPGNRGYIETAINRWFGTEVGSAKPGDKADFEESVKIKYKDNYPNSLTDFMKAEFDDGSQFATFRVDYTGPTNESFSNSVVDSDIASKFNSMSSSGKSAYFSFAGGNVAPLVGGITSAVTSFVSGGLDAFNVSGLLALAGSAFVDIPKHWENSSAQMPKANYTMTLISPYGNSISQMTNIYIPLCMLLAGALPLSAGKQAYTSPFILELYDRGRSQTRLGMIDSLSVQRGTSNLGFNNQGHALAVEVSFSVVDLSSVVAMPIVSRSSLNPLDGLIDDDNSYTDYLNTLGALRLTDQVYKASVLQRNIAKRINRLYQMNSPGKIFGMVKDTPIGLIDVFFKGSAKD